MVSEPGEPNAPYGIAAPGFRLPATARIGRVRLEVSDLAQSVGYYEQVLGLRAYSISDGFATLGPRGEERPLVELHTRQGVTASRRGAFGLYHFAILLPTRAALGAFAAHLGAVGVRAGMADHLVSEALYLWDPDGLGIEVYADRPQETWRARGGELMMATDPLDVGRLVAAAGGQPWEGMPRGSSIGHVHLHVGDLDTAEDFYHAALGLDKTVWSYPGALFLAAGGYHHHLGTNVWAAGPSAREGEARLLDWELILPDRSSVAAAVQSLADAGYSAENIAGRWAVADPWGTRLRIGFADAG